MNKLVAPPEYISPVVEILEVEVENGFSISFGQQGLPGFGFKPTDFGDF